MTSLHDRPNTALVVVDVQNDIVGNAHGRELTALGDVDFRDRLVAS